jgi:hypothetical protein
LCIRNIHIVFYIHTGTNALLIPLHSYIPKNNFPIAHSITTMSARDTVSTAPSPCFPLTSCAWSMLPPPCSPSLSPCPHSLHAPGQCSPFARRAFLIVPTHFMRLVNAPSPLGRRAFLLVPTRSVLSVIVFFGLLCFGLLWYCS